MSNVLGHGTGHCLLALLGIRSGKLSFAPECVELTKEWKNAEGSSGIADRALWALRRSPVHEAASSPPRGADCRPLSDLTVEKFGPRFLQARYCWNEQRTRNY